MIGKRCVHPVFVSSPFPSPPPLQGGCLSPSLLHFAAPTLLPGAVSSPCKLVAYIFTSFIMIIV